MKTLRKIVISTNPPDDTSVLWMDVHTHRVMVYDKNGWTNYSIGSYVDGSDVADGSITTDKIADDAVTGSKIASDAIVLQQTDGEEDVYATTYKLYINDGETEDEGTLIGTINIPKDQHLRDVKVSDTNATLDEDGYIVDGEEAGDTALVFSYYMQDGTYKIAILNLQQFLEENEFGDGLQVIDHNVSVKLSDEEETQKYLSVDENGIAISGIDTAIENAVQNAQTDLQNELNNLSDSLNEEISNRQSADNTLQSNIDAVTDNINNFKEEVANDYVTNTTFETTLSDYVTSISLTDILSDYVTSTSIEDTLNDYVTSTELANTISDYATVSQLNEKQDTLVSGTNIKTINGETVLGSGNIVTPNTTYEEATQSTAGLMSASDKTKLDSIDDNANNYTLSVATSDTLGGIQIGYTESGRNYPVELDSDNKAYVNVPWTDTNTTYSVATTSSNGLMSSTDKSNLDTLTDTIVTTGNGTTYLTNAGTYINPFPAVTEEEVLTILADGTVSHRTFQTMKDWDTTTTDYDLEYLNSTYADVPVGFQLVQYTNGKIYEKVSSTNQWIIINCTLMEE